MTVSTEFDRLIAPGASAAIGEVSAGSQAAAGAGKGPNAGRRGGRGGRELALVLQEALGGA